MYLYKVFYRFYLDNCQAPSDASTLEFRHYKAIEPKEKEFYDFGSVKLNFRYFEIIISRPESQGNVLPFGKFITIFKVTRLNPQPELIRELMKLGELTKFRLIEINSRTYQLVI